MSRIQVKALAAFVAVTVAVSCSTSTGRLKWFDPTWGRHRNKTHPSPGNHDHATENPAGYCGYDWEFKPIPGDTFTDSGSGTCH